MSSFKIHNPLAKNILKNNFFLKKLCFLSYINNDLGARRSSWCRWGFQVYIDKAVSTMLLQPTKLSFGIAWKLILEVD